MSTELRDLRCKITVETHCVLEAVNRVTGEDKSEIVRKILHEWAAKQLHCAKITDALLRGEGMPGITDVGQGRMREGGEK